MGNHYHEKDLAAIERWFDECKQGLWDRDRFIETWQRKRSLERLFDNFNSEVPPDADELGYLNEIRSGKIDGLIDLRNMNKSHDAFDLNGERIKDAIPAEVMTPLYAAQLRALPDDKLVTLVAQLAAMVGDFQALSQEINEFDEPTEFLSSYYKHRISKLVSE